MHMEYGYYFTQLASVIPFLEGLTWKSLTITEAEYNHNVAQVKGAAPLAAAATPATPALVHTNSVVDLLMADLPVPLARASSSVAAAVEPPKADAKPSPSVQLPPATFRFVNRSADSLTLLEVRELLECYKTLASQIHKET